MKALTAAEMREVDRLTTENLGIPSLQLMEAAGRRVAEAFQEIVRGVGDAPRTICVLCGKGNNGGDGFVVARQLHLQSPVSSVHVYLFAQPDELRGDAATNFQRWGELGGKTTTIGDEASWKNAWPEIATASVIVDAIFGTGFRGTAIGPIRQAIEDINRLSQEATAARPALILAVDTPSGLAADGQAAEGPVLRAHKTVTFTTPKVGQLVSRDCSAAGALQVVNIGSPNTLVEDVGKGRLRWIEAEEFAGLPLVRPVDGNKGTFGHVLVVAGSLGKSGAAVMSSHAALRAGAGLVTVATPDIVLPLVAAAHPECMTESLFSTEAGTASMRNILDRPATPRASAESAAPALDSFLKAVKFHFERIQVGKTVIAIGPGLGTHPETQDFVRAVVRHTERPTILDADGLNAFAGRSDELSERQSKFLAITPHPGEMARLLDTTVKAVQEDRVKTATDAARRWNVFVVLKGSHTVIATPGGEVFVNTTGNAGLAKGGSGDVLTGVLAALTAQFKAEDWARVLALGVYLHGAAAELAGAGTDLSGILAGDVVNAIPGARRELLLELQRRG
jgi:ADP-dependent NAD(P)H-hydrate dehydratase / NAD(P)H-hydrate epimerase